VCDYFPAVAAQGSVAIAGTVIVDQIPVIDYRAVKWFVAVANAGLTRVKTYEVYATHRNGITPTFNEYSFLGDLGVNVTNNVTIAAGQLRLEVTNNDIEAMTVYTTRIPVPINSTTPVTTNHVQLHHSSTIVRAGTTGLLHFIPYTMAGLLALRCVITMTTPSGLRQTTQMFARIANTAVGNEYARVGDRSLTHNIIITDVVGEGVEISIQNTSAEDFVIDTTCIPVFTLGSLENCQPSLIEPKIWHPDSMRIPSGQTRVVDILNTPVLTGTKWLMGTIEDITDRTMACEFSATNPTATTGDHTLYGIIADYLNLDVTTSMVAGRLVLEFTNNEANTVTVNLIRVPTAA
jgi:hypothetical protein